MYVILTAAYVLTNLILWNGLSITIIIKYTKDKDFRLKANYQDTYDNFNLF